MLEQLVSGVSAVGRGRKGLGRSTAFRFRAKAEGVTAINRQLFVGQDDDK